MLIIENHVTQISNDKREKHNQALAAQFIAPAPLPEDAELIDKMRNELKGVEGHKVYAQRKSTLEPVFYIIKHVFCLRQLFLLRGSHR